MAWYLRKSVKIGPVRFNFSKNGVGTSIGFKGFRVGVKSSGKSYLTVGGHGVYYHQELGDASKNKTNLTERNKNICLTDLKTVHYSSVTSKELLSNSRKELILSLNNSYRKIRLDFLSGGIFSLLSFIFLSKNSIFGLFLLFFGLVVTIAIGVWESKRRTITIAYEFENEQGNIFNKIIDAFNKIASTKKVWALVDSRNIHGTHESKLNAGASNLINRSDVQIGEGKPPWVNTNIDIPVIKARNQTLYMMPDGILVYDSTGVGFVEYIDISIVDGTTRFIEDNPPNDAKIVGYTWKHPNKKGGPDKRFKHNYQIPICLYGELKIKSKTGMFFYLMTSQYDSPVNFKEAFEKFSTK